SEPPALSSVHRIASDPEIYAIKSASASSDSRAWTPVHKFRSTRRHFLTVDGSTRGCERTITSVTRANEASSSTRACSFHEINRADDTHALAGPASRRLTLVRRWIRSCSRRSDGSDRGDLGCGARLRFGTDGPGDRRQQLSGHDQLG